MAPQNILLKYQRLVSETSRENGRRCFVLVSLLALFLYFETQQKVFCSVRDRNYKRKGVIFIFYFSNVWARIANNTHGKTEFLKFNIRRVLIFIIFLDIVDNRYCKCLIIYLPFGQSSAFKRKLQIGQCIYYVAHHFFFKVPVLICLKTMKTLLCNILQNFGFQSVTKVTSIQRNSQVYLKIQSCDFHVLH